MKKLIAIALLLSCTLSGCGLVGGFGSGVPNYPGAPNRPGRGQNGVCVLNC
jgi:hypothetical protein